jgi:hypothetical protein
MRRLKNIFMVLVAGFLVFGCVRPMEPVISIKNESLLLKSSFSLATIEETIKAAAERRRWVLVKQGPQKFQGSLNSRNRYFLTVEITFTKTTLSIRRLDSKNLRFDGSDIHWKANKWIKDLRTAIIKRTAKLR